MSALGHKRTSGVCRRNVRFTPESGHSSERLERPLCAKSGHQSGWPQHCTCAGTSLFRMRRPQVWKLLEDVGVRLEACGRTLIFRQEGQAVIDHIVSEDPAVRILCWFRWIKT